MDLALAELFLKTVWAGWDEKGLWLLIWTLPDKESRWFSTIREATAYIATLEGRNVFFGVGLRHKAMGVHARGETQDIVALCGMWFDIDFSGPSHHKKELPVSVDEALALLVDKPTLVVSTGYGIHAYWLFREPWLLEDDEEREAALRLAWRWGRAIQLRAGRLGYAVENLCDLPRVLRVAGTRNYKQEPSVETSILVSGGPRYNVSDLEQIVDDIPFEREQRGETLNLVCDYSLSFDPSQLEAMKENDSRFRKTWDRKRVDMADQSPSAYDQSLANQGAEASLSAQEIFSLIVTWRREHHIKPKTHLGYYERTIGGALAWANGRNGSGPHVHAAGSEGDAAADPNAGPKADPVLEATEELSSQFGISIRTLWKHPGDTPSYTFELEDGRVVKVPSIAVLINRAKLALRFAEQLDTIFPKMSVKAWEKVRSLMMQALRIAPSTPDVREEGLLTAYIQKYLIDIRVAGAPTELVESMGMMPTVFAGRIAISALHLRTYIHKNFGQGLSLQRLATTLAAIGATPRQIHVAGKLQSRHLLSRQDFPLAQYVVAAGKKEETDA